MGRFLNKLFIFGRSVFDRSHAVALIVLLAFYGIASLALDRQVLNIDMGSNSSDELNWEYQWSEKDQIAPPLGGDWAKTRIDVTPSGRNMRNYLWLQKELPASIAVGQYFYLPGVYQLVEVFVGTRKVLASPSMGSDHPDVGAHPHFMIPIKPEDAGKLISLRIYSGLSKLGVQGLTNIGTKEEHTNAILKADLPKFVLSLLILCMSFAYMHKNFMRKSGLISLSVLAASFAIHSITRTQIPYMLDINHSLIASLCMLTLFMLLISGANFWFEFMKSQFFRLGRAFRNVQFLAVFSILAASVVQGQRLEYYHDIFGILFMPFIAFIVFATYSDSLKVEAEGMIVGACSVLACIGGIFDGLVILGILPWSDPVTPYFIFPMFMSAFLLKGKTYDSTNVAVSTKTERLEIYQHPLTLAFPKVFEDAYRKFRFDQSRHGFRLVLIATEIVAIVVVTFSYLYMPGLYASNFFWLGAVGVLVYNGFAIKLLSRENAWRYVEAITTIATFILHAAAAAISLQIGPKVMAPVFGPILIVILASSIGGTVQRWLFVVIPLFFICVVWGTVFYMMDAFPSFQGQPVFMIACFILVISQGMILALSREKDSRSMFILAASLESEQAASEKLLTSIMPAHVSRRLKVNEVVADYHPSVTILFADLCGFTSFSSEKSARDLVKVLDELITGFDLEADRIGVEKIKTIGDAYMAVAGLVDAERHADQAVELAQAMLRVLRSYNIENGTQLQLRIGLNSGPVTAGIIGKTKFSYDVWGDAVNVASRMEHGGAPGFVQITESTYQLVTEKSTFSSPVIREVKGKGLMPTYRSEALPSEVPEQKKYG